MYYFKDIIGQKEAQKRLINEVCQQKIPHARMIHGKKGVGTLPLAVAYARYLLCNHPTPTDSCGQCPACRMMDATAHPDMHWVFPTVKRKGSETLCQECMTLWRNMLKNNPYDGIETWMKYLEAQNQQAIINVKESLQLMKKISLKPSQGHRKVVMIWMPEKMNNECANKLLKILEEPPQNTIFILVSEDPEAMPETVRSRTQQLYLPPLDITDIEHELTRRFGLQTIDAQNIARQCQGNWANALQRIGLQNEYKENLKDFIALMRMAYARNIRQMKEWSENMATSGREKQKHFLQYMGRMIRENFAHNFGTTETATMNEDERNFAQRFAPYVNERNIFGMMEETAEAEKHIEQNVNPRMVFFDLAIKMTLLLVQKK